MTYELHYISVFTTLASLTQITIVLINLAPSYSNLEQNLHKVSPCYVDGTIYNFIIITQHS